MNAGTSAYLTGYPGSSVVKAYLMWCGQPIPDTNGTQASQNNAVTFLEPRGVSTSVLPNPAWSQNTIFGGTFTWMTRVQEVINIVTAAGTGVYTVSGVPSGANWSDWAMAVVWSNNAFLPRFMTVGGAESNSNGGGVKFGPTLTSLATLSGPGNPANNFFQCQINNGNSESTTV